MASRPASPNQHTMAFQPQEARVIFGDSATRAPPGSRHAVQASRRHALPWHSDVQNGYQEHVFTRTANRIYYHTAR
eukprot:8550103-Pyramimonas_sp.AAC.1